MEKGFFGAVILIIALPILFLINDTNSNLFSNSLFSNVIISNVQQVSLLRTGAEIYIDDSIEESLPLAAVLETNELSKSMLDSRVILSFYELGLEPKLCKKSFGKAIAISPLELENFSSTTKLISIPAGNFTLIQYIVTGGINKDVFLCTKIESGEYSVDLFIPVGYTADYLVVH